MEGVRGRKRKGKKGKERRQEGRKKKKRKEGRKKGRERKIQTNDTANKIWEWYKKAGWKKRQSINVFSHIDEVLYITVKNYGQEIKH